MYAEPQDEHYREQHDTQTEFYFLPLGNLEQRLSNTIHYLASSANAQPRAHSLFYMFHFFSQPLFILLAH